MDREKLYSLSLMKNNYKPEAILKKAREIADKVFISKVDEKYCPYSREQNRMNKFGDICEIWAYASSFSKNNYITDYFVAESRYTAQKYNFPTPREAFLSDPELNKKIEEYRKRFKITRMTNSQKHNILRLIMNGYKICQLFPIDLALSIFMDVKPKRILDMCAGWGDRLIAAILYGAEYVGVDPNTSINYNNIIEVFSLKAFGEGFSPKNRCRVISDGFEYAELEGEFDLMFSSPPYFNCEKYSTDPKQSFNYGEFADWMNKFMYPSLDKIYRHLCAGGQYMMVINDLKEHKIIDPIIEYSLSIGFRNPRILKCNIDGSIQPIINMFK